MTGAPPRSPLGESLPPELTHACPQDGDGGLMPCCNLTPFEVPRTDRITLDLELVTCGKDQGAS